MFQMLNAGTVRIEQRKATLSASIKKKEEEKRKLLGSGNDRFSKNSNQIISTLSPDEVSGFKTLR